MGDSAVRRVGDCYPTSTADQGTKMTLVLSVNGPETIWLLSDRRLSTPDGRVRKDDARKMMFLETPDGLAMLGYAGLGATARGTEPSDWMSGVLRGRKLPLEASLDALAQAIRREFPKHLRRLPRSAMAAHSVIVPAFLNDEARLYSIVFSADRGQINFRYTRFVTGKTPNRTPRLMVGGSGGMYLYAHPKKWSRHLLRLIRAHDRRRVSSEAVAAHLAEINYEVHSNTTNGSVGPRCIVAWRHRKAGVYKGGGGQECFTGTTVDTNHPSIPTIGNGMDLAAFFDVLTPFVFADLERQPGDPRTALDNDAINEALAKLPETPNEDLP